jgi:hypothetical protein
MERLNSLGVQKVLAKYTAYSGSIQRAFILLLSAMTDANGEGSSAGAVLKMLPPGGAAHALSSKVKRIANKRMRDLS